MHDLRFFWIRLCRRNKGRVGGLPPNFSCDSVGMSDSVGICDCVGMGELFHFRRSEKNGGERKFSAFIMIYHELKHSLIISFITLLSLFEPVEKFAAFFTSECEFSIEKL